MRVLIVAKVLAGCCLSNLMMEIQMSRQPNIANLVTFLQFLSISAYGFIFTAKFGTVKSNIPLKQYAMLVALFFFTSVANNYVYLLHVPSTLHMIIRSASLPASLIVSCCAKSKLPEWNKSIGSLLLSLGVGIAMYGGARVVDENNGVYLHWCFGVSILLSTLFLGAFTGLQQEKLFLKYGNHHEEMLFYTNILSLPLFLGIYPSLNSSLAYFTIDDSIIISGNIICQFICVNAVYELASTENSVTVTLILTIRKFVSLILSTVIFKTSQTIFHLIGSLFVFVGTCVYFNYVIPKFNNKIRKSE